MQLAKELQQELRASTVHISLLELPYKAHEIIPSISE
jgi:hypothetical protein